MATRNPKIIHVIFEEATVHVLSQLAEQENKSLASIVKELALEALEMREDFYLSQVAEALDTSDAATYDHDEAWKASGRKS